MFHVEHFSTLEMDDSPQGADDAPHHDHGGIEHTQQAAGFGSSQASRLSPLSRKPRSQKSEVRAATSEVRVADAHGPDSRRVHHHRRPNVRHHHRRDVHRREVRRDRGRSWGALR
jgi:hypothetical protein